TGEGLLVKRFSISPEFETNSFVYRLSPTRFTTDFYNNFIVSPARMITNVIQEDLWGSPLFSPVPTHTLEDIRFQLWGKVTDFYCDIQNPDQPRAIMGIRLILEKNNGDSFTPVINKTYGAQIELDALDPGLFTDGLNKGINQILDAFYKDMAQAGLTPPNK
ncbi:MAG: ABC transporter, partial [Desulfobacteraceae bacterium]|nr:ABC transporter [Desulfobacteraceae bacterium]